MNKRELFYIIEKGTNTRVMNPDGKPKIIDVTVDDEELERQGWLYKFRKTSRISIEEYETKFEDF